MSLFKFFKAKPAKAQASTPEAAPPASSATPAAVATPGAPAPKPATGPVPSVMPNIGLNIKMSYGQPAMSWGMPQAAATTAPETPAQLFEQAQTLHKQGQLTPAKPLYERLLQAEPQHVHGLHYLGLLHVQLGHLHQGMDLIRQSLAIDPQQFGALGNLAGALQEAGQLNEAIASLDAALALKQDVPELWNNRGNMLLQMQRLDEAIASFEHALALNPKLATAANHLAIALSMQGQFDRALQAADQAIAHAPQLADAHDTRGSALRRLQRPQEALASYEQALALRPQQLSYLANRCSVLEDMDRYEEAIAALRHIRTLDPQFKCIKGRLLHAQRRCLDWTDIQALTHEVEQDTLAGQLSDAPLNMLAISGNAQVQHACAQQAMADQPTIARTHIAPRVRQAGEKIRIAYVSADLREHAVSYLMAGVFEQHDRSQFEITAISLKPAQDSAMGRRVQAAFDSFLDVSHWTDGQIIDHMHKHGYDIAVDLMGLTFGARPGIWAHGIAPVHISYLGYPGTTGAAYMDVILADDMVIPPEQRQHYSERVVYLPDCFQANDRQRAIATHMPSRAELGLPDDAFVFCSFNNLYKIGPDTFDSWARILEQVPGSVLWLVDDQDIAQRHARQEAHSRGIDPSRLIFAPRVAYPDHLARMRRADLFLDTLPFNAGTTASDALWAGLPLLTQPGQAFASRMAASLLRAIGLPELITHSAAEYEALAVQLARHPHQLQAMRQRLVDNRLSSPLFDTTRFTRNLEDAYRSLVN